MTRAWLVAMALAACAPGDPCDTLDDLGTSPMALELTEAEHPGWGRTTCLQCHPIHTFHVADCVAGAEVDVDAIEADPEDPTTCVPCHGANGVAALQPSDTGDEP